MSLRIAGGSARGRPLKVPSTGTRPTSERARAGLFNRLATLTDIEGASVLDLYAGSGAVGLEAVSRGAGMAVLVDSDRRTADVIKANAGLLRRQSAVVHVRASTVATFTASQAVDVPGIPFDIVFADPPYDVGDDAVATLLQALVRPRWTAPDALFVIERSSRSPQPNWPEQIEALAPKKYGEATLWYGRAR